MWKAKAHSPQAPIRLHYNISDDESPEIQRNIENHASRNYNLVKLKELVTCMIDIKEFIFRHFYTTLENPSYRRSTALALMNAH